MTEPRGDEATGEPPLADEALRLFGVVQQWARQTFPAPAGGTAGTTCEWCPLCQFMAVLRGERPEVTERVAEAGAAVLGAVKTLLDAASSSRPDPGRPRVQRIDLGEGA